MEYSTDDLSRIKRLTWITLFCALLFMVFFDASKHLPGLALVNVFGEDPFDAVGSFGVQLTGFACLLAIIRVLSLRSNEGTFIDNSGSIIRCNLVALASILVTLGADIMALLRFPQKWMNQPAGVILAALTLGLFALTVVLFDLNRFRKYIQIKITPKQLTLSALIGISSGLILLLVPENRFGMMIGRIGAALIGMVVLFSTTAAITQIAFPIPADSNQDLVDDLAAIIQKLRVKAKIWPGFFHFLKRVIRWPGIHHFIRWINPRRHPWRIVIGAAAVLGLTLFFIEALGEGAPDAKKFALVLTVVVGIESIGVITGYALFRKYLNIFKTHQEEKS